ncbi:unnamed protein product, partial [Staurois parvus]
APLGSEYPILTVWLSQPGAHCACARRAALCEWPCSLLEPATCTRRLRVGGGTTSASDLLGDHSGSGSGYLSNTGTRSSKVPILNGERGTKA